MVEALSPELERLQSYQVTSMGGGGSLNFLAQLSIRCPLPCRRCMQASFAALLIIAWLLARAREYCIAMLVRRYGTNLLSTQVGCCRQRQKRKRYPALCALDSFVQRFLGKEP